MTFFNKKGKKVGEKFRKTFKGALSHARKKGMKGDKAEEYAMRTALDGMPKSYFKEPGPEHGPGKSGPLTAKRSKKAADAQQVKTAQPPRQPQLGPVREEPGVLEGLKSDWQRWWDELRGKPPAGEVEFDPTKVRVTPPVKERVVKHPPRYRYDDLVKDVQSALAKYFKNPAIVGAKGPDGFWGPATSAAWNKWRAATGNDAVGMAKGRQKPSDKALYWMAYKWAPVALKSKPATRPAPKPAPKPAPAKPKPVPQLGHGEKAPAEMPSGLTPRQQELWRRTRGEVEKPYGGA